MLNILIERQKLLNVHDLEVGRLFSVDKLERERMRMAPAHGTRQGSHGSL